MITPLLLALQILDAHPPDWAPNPERENAFLEIGRFLEQNIRPSAPLDLATNPNPLWTLLAQRLDKTLADIRHSPPPPPGSFTLWQLYNSGVIIQTSGQIFGVDLLPVPVPYGWPDELHMTQSLAQMLDLLLVTHRHKDHYSPELVRQCLALGKPVLLPPDLAAQWPPSPFLHTTQAPEAAFELAGLPITARRAIHVWKPDLDACPLLTYEITLPSRHTLLFTGDADYTRPPFRKTPDKNIDILFINWRNPSALYEDGHAQQIGRTEDAVRIALDLIQPRRLILEHYGELEHVRDGFSPSYDLAIRLKHHYAPLPVEFLFWGEHLSINNQKE